MNRGRTFMKANFVRSLCVICALSVSAASAQETNEVEQLKRELREMRDQMLRMEQKLETLEQKKPETAVAQPKPAEPPPATPTAEQVQELNEKVDRVARSAEKSPAQRVQPGHRPGGRNDLLLSQQGQAADGQRSARRVRCVPAFGGVERSPRRSIRSRKAYVVINASADAGHRRGDLSASKKRRCRRLRCRGTSTLKAGRFFGEFGRLAYIHDHELPFVNRPLVLDQYIGGESRTDGAQLNWLSADQTITSA